VIEPLPSLSCRRCPGGRRGRPGPGGPARGTLGTQPVVLSGGEQQRVNLAAGTLGAPRLLLLVEPVAALDCGHRETVFRLIRELSRAGVSVLSVFHDPEAVRALADRVVVLRDGQVAAEGTPGQVLRYTRLGP
jgi:alpha-D-ribose 1-methylphosphonate 5-triphosphate synthase subunit PhnL